MSNYPIGAKDHPDAPYNEVKYSEKEYTLTISETLSKTVKVKTNKFIEDLMEDNDVDWGDVYIQDHYTPMELIIKMRDFLVDNEPKDKDSRDYKRWKHLIKECSGWNEDECEIIKE